MIRIGGFAIPAVSATLVLLALLFQVDKGTGGEKKGEMSTATFAVHCYDVGADALKGMPGVIDVKKGFRGFRETDTVTYDPSVTTVDKMEEALKRAGTWRETIP